MRSRNERRWRRILRPDLSLAMYQAQWEQRHALRRAHEAGASVEELAASLGVEPKVIDYRIRRARSNVKHGTKSPIELWMSDSATRRKYLADKFLAHAALRAGDKQSDEGMK